MFKYNYMTTLNKETGAVILAAGKGTRLKCSDCPKVMLKIGGRAIVSYIVQTLFEMGFGKDRLALVVGFQKDKVKEYFGEGFIYAEQEEQMGTAHAAYIGMKQLPPEVKYILVLGGDDSAFYTPATLLDFIARHIKAGAVLSLITAEVKNPSGLGRIVRHEDGLVEIIEKEYLTEEQNKIKEISTGTFCFDRAWFEKMFLTMPKLRKLGEYGLPTALAMARESDLPVQFIKLENPDEWFGVNTPEELEEAQRRKK